MKTSKNSSLAFSTDSTKNQSCKTCKNKIEDCSCDRGTAQTPKNITAILRIEKSGRNGKTVTVLDKLPKNEEFLKNLCTGLKNKCGSGGTYHMDQKDGVVEIQGDKRDQIRQFLLKEGISSKGGH